MRTAKRILCLLLCLALCAPLMTASAAGEAKVEFKAGAPDASGVFTVTMTIKNATFNAFQFALRFDPAVIQPVDKTGASTSEFSSCADSASWLSTIGCSVNAETGFLGFTGYISPGESDALITNGEAVLGASPVEVFSFRFKQLKAGDPAMKIATEAQGEPYEHAFPEGAGVMGRAGRTTGEIVFDMTALSGGASSGGSLSGGEEQKPSYTADSLLKACIIMKIGSHAVVAEGGVTAFYPGEPDVTPYIDYPDRTFVPLRFVAEKLGCTVDWDDEAKAAIIVKDGVTIKMPIGSTTYTVNGEKKTMDAAPVLKDVAGKDARTMVPIRFVAEALGKTVDWDDGYKFGIIAPGDYDWDPAGALEKEVVDKANSMLLMYGSFV